MGARGVVTTEGSTVAPPFLRRERSLESAILVECVHNFAVFYQEVVYFDTGSRYKVWCDCKYSLDVDHLRICPAHCELVGFAVWEVLLVCPLAIGWVEWH
jgi:hypothetical protein